jgi:peptidyl-prolyl cis-trans isomerase-like 3
MSVTLHTNLGDLKVELFCELAPKACKNFLALAAAGLYDNTLFHRSIRRFMLQGGDIEFGKAGANHPKAGKGGYSIYGKYFADELSDVLKHDARGVLSMANRGPGTNASQFFFTYDKAPHLNNINTVFGRIIHGDDTLENIEKVPVDAKDRPLHEVKLINITIHANPIADKER